MTADRPRNAGWWALLAVPVLCCIGHAVLLAVGVGSLTAVAAGVTGSALVATAGVLLLAAALVVLMRRRRQQPAAAAHPADRPARTLDQGAP